ncbi:hypothetical protein PVL29_014690 [Vitis rotundifolia]|uniref:Uncharacterized protein n=1 Tax=Vitis rotundifolia TaxID=103349 RepID=A0AA38ZIT9_VITRO|nr:hypothetical protein PVL29_014690 [Vitis rotundifolia]
MTVVDHPSQIARNEAETSDNLNVQISFLGTRLEEMTLANDRCLTSLKQRIDGFSRGIQSSLHGQPENHGFMEIVSHAASKKILQTPRDTKLEQGTVTDSPKSLAACSIPWKLKFLSTESVSNGREEITRGWKDESPSGLRSSGSKHKNKLNKIVTERKYRSKSGSDYGENASDREIRRRLSKLNKKSMNSGSDSCEDLDGSSEGGSSGSEGTASDTESDSDFCSEGGVAESRVDGYFTDDEGLYSMIDDR